MKRNLTAYQTSVLILLFNVTPYELLQQCQRDSSSGLQICVVSFQPYRKCHKQDRSMVRSIQQSETELCHLQQVTDFLRMLHQGSKQLRISYCEFYRPDMHGITQMSAGFQDQSFVCSKSRRANPSAFLPCFAKSPKKVQIPNISHSLNNSDIRD